MKIIFSKEPLGIEIVNGDAQNILSTTKSTKGGLNVMVEDKNKKEPPPPPPPPPKRLIREDVQIGDKKGPDKKERSE